MFGLDEKIIKTIFLLVLLVVMQNSFLFAADRNVKVTASTQSSELSDSKEKELDKNSQMKTNRNSNYKDISDPALFIGDKKVTKINKFFVKERSPSKSSNSNSSNFYIAETSVILNTDQDYDGYYSDFTVIFDVDTVYDHAHIYANLYLSFEGQPWQLYYSTDVFTVNGYSSSDDYRVRTTLATGFPPGSYDILIEVFDDFDSSFATSISADDTYALAEYYLEDTSYDNSPYIDTGFSIYDASLTLLTDQDNDGFYQSFSLQFDADVVDGDALIYAEIWVKDQQGNWQKDYTTDDFIIEGNSTLDTFILESVWESGYTTGYYDFSIEIYDAYSQELLATSENLDDKLTAVPLEDASYDVVPTSSNPPSTPTTSYSSESGGAGSSGIIGFLLTGLLYLRRKY